MSRGDYMDYNVGHNRSADWAAATSDDIILNLTGVIKTNRGGEPKQTYMHSLGGADKLAVAWHHLLVGNRPAGGTECNVAHRSYESAVE